MSEFSWDVKKKVLLINFWIISEKRWGKKQMFMKKKVTCISFLLHFWGSNETNPTKLTHQLFFFKFIYLLNGWFWNIRVTAVTLLYFFSGSLAGEINNFT